MQKLSKTQLIAAMLEMTEKEAHILAVQTVDLLKAIQQRKFQQALKEYESVLERVTFLGGMLHRTKGISPRLS